MWYVLLFAVVFLADQITKIIVAYLSGATGNAAGGISVKWLIPNFLEINYSENRNGMMSLFSKIADEKTRYMIFMISTVVISLAILAYLIFFKKKGKWNTFALTLVLAGALGNFVDRALYVYVRDFIHVKLFNDIFPYIFNIADSAIVVGAIMLLLGILFIDKDALFRSSKKKKEKEGEEETAQEKPSEDGTAV